MEHNIQKVELKNYGSLVAFNEDKTPSNESISGYFLHSDRVEFIEQSDVLHGAVGLSFGIEYFISGLDPGAKKQDTRFASIIKHPLMTNPATGKSATQVKEEKYNYLNQTNYDSFTFEYDWEVVLGIWTFQITQDNNILLEKTFEII